MSSPPDLVLVAHGTRDPAGPPVLDRLAARLGSALPSVRVRVSYVELVAPAAADLLRAAQDPTVVVPALLSTGYHVKTDLPEAVARASVSVELTPPLGPDTALVSALIDRLLECGARLGDPVVLAAAGSSDPDASRAVERMTAMLGARWGGPVEIAFASMGTPVVDAVHWVRRRAPRGRVVVAPYLLAPGRFAREVERDAVGCGARVGKVLGDHDAVIGLVRRRYGSAFLTTSRRLETSQSCLPDFPHEHLRERSHSPASLCSACLRGPR